MTLTILEYRVEGIMRPGIIWGAGKGHITANRHIQVSAPVSLPLLKPTHPPENTP